MGGTGVIDNFLGIFTSYIDSGFGLLGGEVAFIATTLIVIDVTLAALFWAWGADGDIIARLVKKTLFVGVFAYLISNWNNLARIVFESFAGLGLMASGTGFSVADLLRPGRVAQTGLDAGRPLLESISDLMGWIAFFENFIQISCLLFAWALEQHMRRLCAGYSLPKVKVQPHCWWAAQPVGRAALLESGLERVQGRAARHRLVDTDHQGIVRHPQVLQELTALLAT